MLSALHLLFSSGTVSEYVETSEWKNKVILNFSVIYQKIICCDLCCLLHCHCLISPVDRKFVYNSLHYPGCLRRCSICKPLADAQPS